MSPAELAAADAAFYHPLWVPRAFGPVLDAYVDALVSFAAAICRSAYGFGDPSAVAQRAYDNRSFPEWLACAARLPAEVTEDDFRALTSLFYSTAIWPIPPGTILEPPERRDSPPELAICDPMQRPTVGRCNGTIDRPDGADERNCDPTAAEYDCGDGSGCTLAHL